MAADPFELIVRLLSTHQERIFRYVMALVPHEHDARDIVQETSVALYRRAAEYNPDQPFLPWAYRFAYLHVLKHRERQGRLPMMLGDDVLELLAREYGPSEDWLAARATALSGCLEALPGADREMIRKRYQNPSAQSADAIAEELGMSRRTYFRNLERIRRLLFDCVSGRMDKDAEGVLV